MESDWLDFDEHHPTVLAILTQRTGRERMTTTKAMNIAAALAREL